MTPILASHSLRAPRVPLHGDGADRRVPKAECYPESEQAGPGQHRLPHRQEQIGSRRVGGGVLLRHGEHPRHSAPRRRPTSGRRPETQPSATRSSTHRPTAPRTRHTSRLPPRRSRHTAAAPSRTPRPFSPRPASHRIVPPAQSASANTPTTMPASISTENIPCVAGLYRRLRNSAGL